MQRRFQLVDVFAADPLRGNPVAVVLDAEGLSHDQMLDFTRWMNLSETTFLLPPTSDSADYRARIFTLDREMPFAGHPTLGSCHAWLACGGIPDQATEIIQDCGAGLIPIRRSSERLAFAAPPLIKDGPVAEETLKEIAGVLRIPRDAIVDAQWVDNGPGWVAVLLASAEEVLALEPAGNHPARLDLAIVGPCNSQSDAAFELRALFSDHNGYLREDPVTGSLNASVAQWLLASGRVQAPFLARQGARLGRNGQIQIDQDSKGNVWVGGNTLTVAEGSVDL